MPNAVVTLAVVLTLSTGCEPQREPSPAPPTESINQARQPEGTLIPRSMADKGQYYLLESERSGHIVRALHKRVGVDTVGWTRTETNCKTKKMREMGYTEASPQAMKEEPTKWFDLVDGSSKSDLAKFVCKK